MRCLYRIVITVKRGPSKVIGARTREQADAIWAKVKQRNPAADVQLVVGGVRQ